MIDQNFGGFNHQQLPLLQTNAINVGARSNGTTAEGSPNNEATAYSVAASAANPAAAIAGAYSTTNGPTSPSSFVAANYAMSQQISQPNYAASISSGDFNMYRSSYLHSHAKPPYSYISLIAMAIQVIKIESDSKNEK